MDAAIRRRSRHFSLKSSPGAVLRLQFCFLASRAAELADRTRSARTETRLEIASGGTVPEIETDFSKAIPAANTTAETTVTCGQTQKC